MQRILLSDFVFLLMFVFIFPASTYSQQEKKISACLTADEVELYDLISSYRKEHSLPKIPLSVSLTYVAKQHLIDLAENRPDQKKRCNMHSWSNKGPWSSCCYTEDHDEADCMWDKPRELTNYTGDGFEIIAAMLGLNRDNCYLTPEMALQLWKDSPGHNALIVEEYPWEKGEWAVMGLAIYKGYAAIWFGTVKDPDGAPDLCR